MAEPIASEHVDCVCVIALAARGGRQNFHIAGLRLKLGMILVLLMKMQFKIIYYLLIFMC